MKHVPHPHRLIALAAAALLAACAPMPAAQVPAEPIAVAPFRSAPELPRGSVENRWTALGDAPLNQLIERSIDRNLDLALALERLQRSRALAQAADAARWPTADLQASASEGAASERSSAATVGLQLAWELDLFDRLGRLQQAAQWRSKAATADLAALQRTIAGEVAQAWYAWVSAHEQLSLTQAALKNRSAALQIVRDRYRAGMASALDEARAQSEWSGLQAMLPSLQADATLASHRLAVLVGEQPGDTVTPPAPPTPMAPTAIALRLPDTATWLASRPDIAAAEARLKALSMDAEAVRAEFMPRVSVGGFVGWLAGSALGLGTSGTSAWLISPSVSLPLLNQGALQGRLEAAQADERAALIAYRQRVLLAAEEVENALTRVSRGRERLIALDAHSRQALRVEQLAQQRYRHGVADQLEWLDAQRRAHEAQLQWTQAVGRHRQDVALLLRALGAS